LFVEALCGVAFSLQLLSSVTALVSDLNNTINDDSGKEDKPPLVTVKVHTPSRYAELKHRVKANTDNPNIIQWSPSQRSPLTTSRQSRQQPPKQDEQVPASGTSLMRSMARLDELLQKGIKGKSRQIDTGTLSPSLTLPTRVTHRFILDHEQV
jgi:hypothetical protein